jgi:ubiquinone/menaquinone biosynthesis C-methylase UbiE
MDVTRQNGNEQTRLWNGPAGHAWVELQELLDQVLKPFEDLLVEAVVEESATHVLDVGCGTGTTTLAVGRLIGMNGRSVGVDISDPLIAAAQARAKRERSPASFIRADAQTYAFETRTFDMLISRFGVMFFNDPVQAFTNLRRAASQGSALRFVAWRSATENPFMTTAERAAAPLLADLPARQPNAPGQFAFADGRRVYSILEQSGWEQIDVQPIDITCSLPEKDLVRYIAGLGPVGLALQQADDRTRMQVIETVCAAFKPYVHGAEIRFTAACWMVGARALSASAPST